MTNPHKLYECTDMTEEKFNECLQRVDMRVFIENPTQALIESGITLKKGINFKFVHTEEEVNSLPANVFPLMLTPKNNEELSLENLEKVAGGWYWQRVVRDGRIGSERVEDGTNTYNGTIGLDGKKI